MCCFDMSNWCKCQCGIGDNDMRIGNLCKTPMGKEYSGKGYVYFSYLNNAAWVGLNEREMITAASRKKTEAVIEEKKSADVIEGSND